MDLGGVQAESTQHKEFAIIKETFPEMSIEKIYWVLHKMKSFEAFMLFLSHSLPFCISRSRSRISSKCLRGAGNNIVQKPLGRAEQDGV